MTLVNSSVDLDSRLSAVAEMVLPGLAMADIGTDHGFLPAALVLGGHVPWAIAGDVGAAPLAGALRCGDRVMHRQGDGLDVLPDEGVGTVVIAGMGPATVLGILDRGRRFWPTVKRFVLQPNHGLGQVRQTLNARGWALVEERMVQERGRFYGAMAWSVSEPPGADWSREEVAFGP